MKNFTDTKVWLINYQESFRLHKEDFRTKKLMISKKVFEIFPNSVEKISDKKYDWYVFLQLCRPYGERLTLHKEDFRPKKAWDLETIF